MGEKSGKSRKSNLLSNIWDFLKVRKQWWLLPLIIMILILGTLLVIASSSKVSVFVYTLI